LKSSIDKLLRDLGGQNVEIADELLPVLKRAVLTTRLNLASRLDVSKSRASDPELVSLLEKQLEEHDAETKQEWFWKTKAIPMPHLADFLTIERVEYLLRQELEFPQREYDEKFHILQAPTIFLPDLDYQRKKCGMRGLPLVAEFMDIDDFKSFNTAHGETHIDRYLLPRFMAALEGHVYGHGCAYRFGGDEYVVLLPNSDRVLAIVLLERFQKRLQELDYGGVEKRATVSIGFCEVSVDSHLTNREILQRAEHAKNFAKKQGKNCLATYTDELLEQVQVVGRAPS
jgi:diguanylate cyclase (GGDEF)-like protein